MILLLIFLLPLVLYEMGKWNYRKALKEMEGLHLTENQKLYVLQEKYKFYSLEESIQVPTWIDHLFSGIYYTFNF